MAATWITVLGVAQDGGFPQINCRRACCEHAWKDPSVSRRVVALGLVDSQSQKAWLFDATPDIPAQLHDLLDQAPGCQLAGIFLTHGHIGHYTGLMYLGREAMGATEVPVYAMPRMRQFLSANAPWQQLLALHNISPQPLEADQPQILAEGTSILVTPVLVPHRDEYTETVGYVIQGPHRKALFIPDIDKWEKWDRDVRTEYIHKVDIAFLDGTFFSAGELPPGRDMRDIPHPSIEESLAHFASMSAEDKAKVHFIHLNHTNPLLQAGSAACRQVSEAGFRIAEQGMRFEL
eukprot:jgi/Mesvir1/19602/Mv09899-RA.1